MTLDLLECEQNTKVNDFGFVRMWTKHFNS